MKRKLKHEIPMRIICAVLFATFSFLYIYLYQGELLACVQDHLAQGQTSNNTFITAAIITLLLSGLQYVLNRMSKLHGHFEALSYLPSCVLLALLTKVDAAYSYSWVQWVVALLTVTVLYILIVWVNRNTLQLRDSLFIPMLTLNLGVLSALFLFTGWYGNNDASLHLELSAWKHTHSEHYDKVLQVGTRSDDTNADLTALRNLALAKTGQLGHKLFTYPQPYGSEGLLMHRNTMQQPPSYGADEYYRLLGQSPAEGESAIDFYHRLAQQSDTVMHRELYVAALLLDKDLDTFVSLTVDESAPELLSAAPKHYQEAWMIYNEQHPFTLVPFVPDTALAERYQAYLTLYEQYAGDPTVMSSLVKRQFGDTYWYYYDFVD